MDGAGEQGRRGVGERESEGGGEREGEELGIEGHVVCVVFLNLERWVGGWVEEEKGV